MDSGKSTLAMQTDFNFARNGRRGLVFTSHDRGGVAKVTSRIGLETAAIEVTPELNFWDYLQQLAGAEAGLPVDYLVCDEAQFYTAVQVDQLARIVDELGVEVLAFGITTDFRAQLFEGSRRFIELADQVEWLQLQNFCWCGQRATHNARKINGVMVTEGEQVLPGDTDAGAVAYEVLCRRHHMRGEVAPAVATVSMGEPGVLD